MCIISVLWANDQLRNSRAHVLILRTLSSRPSHTKVPVVEEIPDTHSAGAVCGRYVARCSVTRCALSVSPLDAMGAYYLRSHHPRAVSQLLLLGLRQSSQEAIQGLFFYLSATLLQCKLFAQLQISV